MALNLLPMEVAKEIVTDFLSSSTIHGISYIASSKSKVAKIIWSIIVVCSFIAAGYLINSSYSAWTDSPISTTVTTHPIASLEFPKVTICPPKGSNTALNQDILTAANKSITLKEFELLSNAIQNIFVNEPFAQFTNDLIDIANIENLRNVYEGHQSFPRPFKTFTKEIKISSLHGKIRSLDVVPAKDQNIYYVL